MAGPGSPASAKWAATRSGSAAAVSGNFSSSAWAMRAWVDWRTERRSDWYAASWISAWRNDQLGSPAAPTGDTGTTSCASDSAVRDSSTVATGASRIASSMVRPNVRPSTAAVWATALPAPRRSSRAMSDP